MSNAIVYELDSLFEIMGLNFVCNHLDKIKEDTKKSISDMGYDGDLFYEQHFNLFDKYTKIFVENMVTDSNKPFYFAESDDFFFLILLLIVLEYRDELSTIDNLSDELLRGKIIQICNGVLDKSDKVEDINKIEDIISFLEQSNIEGNAKWKLLQIMQRPKLHIAQLNEIIQSDMQAYYKAVKGVKKPLDKLLKHFELAINNQNDTKFVEMKDKFAKVAKIYPSLVFPVTQIFYEKNCYYGLLTDKLTKSEKEFDYSKEMFQSKLKALSDSSKLEILLALKERPMYNLEIAKQLGLTAATMSHHMNVLLYCGFVTVEKKDGKVYYCLEKESFKILVKEIEKLFME